jgi:osmotically-inducible protein OsmY
VTAGNTAEQNASAPTERDDLLDRLNHILEEAGIYVAAELRDGVLTLTGQVDSAENRQAALDVAAALAEPRGLRIDDGIDVLNAEPATAFEDPAGDDAGPFGYVDPDVDDDTRLDAGFELDADLTDDIGTTDPEEAAAEAIPYFPPTDPVVRPTAGAEELVVVGGFGATSTDDTDSEAGFDARNDDDISLQVLRELREDALTTDLVIRVGTRNGVVHLHGEVPTLEDAENAEAVASRVGGVQEVREELVIAGLQRE